MPKTTRILRIGDTYARGKVIDIEGEDRGWWVTLQYKKHTRRVFLYHA